LCAGRIARAKVGVTADGIFGLDTEAAVRKSRGGEWVGGGWDCGAEDLGVDLRGRFGFCTV